MSRQLLPVSRRRFLQSTTLGAAAAAAGVLHAPAVLRAQGAPVKVGVLHPVSGALSYSGQQGRLGAAMAIEEINAAGGIKALGGAKIEAVLGDAQSTPEGGNAEVEKMNSAPASRPSSAAMPAASASPPARPRRATTCLTSSTSAWSTPSSPAG